MNKNLKLIISIQLLIIGILTNKIITSRSKVLGISISPINKDFVKQNDKSIIKNYYEPKPNQRETVLDLSNQEATYTINSDSLNETKEYQIQPPTNTYRIITLGDSFTFGQYINTHQNWTELLEKDLNKNCSNNFEVINLGVMDYGITESIERYKIRGEKYHPNLIIWFLKIDDFEQAKEKNLDSKQLLKSFLSSIQNNSLIITYASTQNKYKKILKNISNNSTQIELLELTEVDQPKYHLPDYHQNKDGHIQTSKEVYNFLTNKIIKCHH